MGLEGQGRMSVIQGWALYVPPGRMVNTVLHRTEL